MKPNRYVQNFRERRALLISNDARAVDTLSAMVTRLGMTPEWIAKPDGEFRVSSTAGDDRDVLFIDGDLNLLVDDNNGADFDLPRTPVVGLVGIEAPSRLRALMQFGATAFLPKPVHSGSVFSALYLAVNTFEQISGLQVSIRELEHRRSYRRHIIKAVTLVMRTHTLDDEGAFALLRKEAMRARMSLEVFCEGVVQRSTMRVFGEIEPAKKQAAGD